MQVRVEIVRYEGCFAQERWSSDSLLDGPTSVAVDACGLAASLQCVGEEVVLRAEASQNLTGFGIDLVLEWPFDGEDYLLVPGAIYDGNRFSVLPVPYPPMYDATDPSGEVIVTDVPRLPAFHLLAGDASYPALGVWDRKNGRARAVLFPDRTDLGDVGLRVEESPSGLAIRVQLPGVRPERYTMVRTDSPSVDRGARILAGWSLATRVALLEAPALEVDNLFALLDDNRNRIVEPGAFRPIRPLSSSSDLVARAAIEDRWIEEPGFFSTADTDHGTPFQVGWTGGGITSFAVGQTGEPLAVERAHRNVDFICATLQAPSGFFYGGYGDAVLNDGFGQPHAENWAMVRKSGDMLLFLMRQLLALEEPPSEWEATALRCAEAFARNREDLGQFVDVRDGSVVVGGSACGGTAIAGLALAATYFERPELRRAAERAGERYAERCVLPGLLTGGPGEILNAPDSESAFGLVEGYMTLWEATGAERWLDLAARAARQAASWTVPYDFAFPPDSTFGRMRMGTAGTVIANVQNKHSAPGICTGSALPLLKLYRATGERRWLDLAAEISHALPQYVSSAERPIIAEDGRPLPRGWVNERVNMSDWEMPGRGLGEVYCGPCWPMTTVLLTALEMPGVYVDLASGSIACADHVQARIQRTDLVLTNSTPYAASVRVMIDEDRARPIGELWWTSAQPVTVAAGAEVLIPLPTPALAAAGTSV